MKKNEIRKEIMSILSNVEPEKYEEAELALQERLFSLPAWKEAKSIGVTVSQDNEWDTKPIIEKAWEQGKRVSVPKSIHKPRELHFYQLEDFNQLEVGYYDLEEPVPEKTTRTSSEEIELLIVPGLAFNEEGYRVGFGGGFYDRFLANFPNHTVSLAHTSQIVKDMPVEEFDIPVDKIITEESIIDTKEYRKN